MTKIDAGLSSVNGFTFAACECGIRYENRLDFCMIFSTKPCSASGMFTTNKVFAAPVQLCRERINNAIHGILINSTNANACTGDHGYKNTLILTERAENLTGVENGSFLMASTGIIGHQLPVEKMIQSEKVLVENLSNENGCKIPIAIMTTDTRPKETAREFDTTLGTFRVAGTAKGSGMIAPNMATLLSFIITDAPVRKNILDEIFQEVVEKTFNAITIDGDMSTNDSAIILSPKDGQYLEIQSDLNSFREALGDLCSELSYMLIKDAEGGTKCVKISINGAKNADEAKTAAKSISESLLVKTAFFGSDPNWGRIACAAGYSGVSFNLNDLDIIIDGIILLKNGEPADYNSKLLAESMKKNEYEIIVKLGNGTGSFSYMTSDISYEYIKINGEYST